MQRLGVSGAVQPLYGSLGVKELIQITHVINSDKHVINSDKHVINESQTDISVSN